MSYYPHDEGCKVSLYNAPSTECDCVRRVLVEKDARITALEAERSELLETFQKIDKWITDEQIRGRLTNLDRYIRDDVRNAIAKTQSSNHQP